MQEERIEWPNGAKIAVSINMAFEAFVRHIPAKSGIAWVLIQHMAPDRESHLEGILARHTALRAGFRERAGGQPVQLVRRTATIRNLVIITREIAACASLSRESAARSSSCARPGL